MLTVSLYDSACMHACRLDMGTKLRCGEHKNLYSFWEDTITGQLQRCVFWSSNLCLEMRSTNLCPSAVFCIPACHYAWAAAHVTGVALTEFSLARDTITGQLQRCAFSVETLCLQFAQLDPSMPQCMGSGSSHWCCALAVTPSCKGYVCAQTQLQHCTIVHTCGTTSTKQSRSTCHGSSSAQLWCHTGVPGCCSVFAP